VDKVVVSVDGSEASKAAVRWCADNLDSSSTVIAVAGLSEVAEFVIALPAFDAGWSPAQIRDTVRTIWCRPLEHAGLEWHPRFAHSTQAAAVSEAIDAEQPDLVVIGSPAHPELDMVLGGQLHHVLHHAMCPVLLVPPPSSENTAAREGSRAGRDTAVGSR
jgi:nucleotide-binding universal stress UspA family protein